MTYCYECGHDSDLNDRSWWSLRPRTLRPITMALAPWRRHVARPFRAWWYAPALGRKWAREERPERCYDLLAPIHQRRGPYGLAMLDLGGGQPWEYVNPNPMPAFRLWRIWPGLPAQTPPGPPFTWRDFMPSFIVEREAITWVREAES